MNQWVKKALAILALALVAASFAVLAAYAETPREKFKSRITAMYDKMEELAKADGCTETQRYWTHESKGHSVVLWVECVKSKQRYWLSTPDAHRKVQNAQ